MTYLFIPEVWLWVSLSNRSRSCNTITKICLLPWIYS